MHKQGGLVVPCVGNVENMALAVVGELHNGSSDCQVVEVPWAVHRSPKNGCRHSRCFHSMTVGEAYLEGCAASQNLQQNSRCSR